MQRKQSYVSSKLWYLFNSKLYSTSAKTGTSIPPLIEVDSLLMSWGLLSGHYQNDGTIQTTKWSRFHQLFTKVFLWFMLIRSVLYIFVDENSIWIQYIGDLSITLNVSTILFEFLVFKGTAHKYLLKQPIIVNKYLKPLFSLENCCISTISHYHC